MALEPLLPIFATKGIEELGEQAGGALWTAVKEKFDTRAAAKEAFTDLLKSPDDRDLQASFRVHLKKLLEDDATFATNLDRLLKAVDTTHSATVIGNGAIAQGEGATALGAGGVSVGGNMSDSNIVTGDNNTVRG